MRVFAVSDLHADYVDNLNWVRRLSRVDYRNDVLLLAGDVSDLPGCLEEVFQQLTARFATVMFVPGNHELWVLRCRTKTSLEKLDLIQSMARAHRVLTCPYRRDGVLFVPLLGWYDYSFGTPGDTLLEGWMDFHACVWPAGLDEASLTRHFLVQNRIPTAMPGDVVISFSHFLPRLDVLPGYIPASRRFLHPVLGTKLLEEQIRSLRSSIHVYGHSHVNQSVRIEGTLYVNNALGYPSESYMTHGALRCVYDTASPKAEPTRDGR
jgi:predicted phosphodiesterase